MGETEAGSLNKYQNLSAVRQQAWFLAALTQLTSASEPEEVVSLCKHGLPPSCPGRVKQTA